MLVNFKVGNFLSIKEPISFSMLASNSIKELEDSQGISNQNIFYINKNKYLKSSVLYGANGSGKSNFINAIYFFKKFILTSSTKYQAEDEIEIIPFLLNEVYGDKPTFFEVTFLIDSVLYRYGFTVTENEVVSEWLFGKSIETSVGRESTYFVRQGSKVKIVSKNYKEGKGIISNTRKNALFLSTVAQLNGVVSNQILKWFSHNLHILSGLDDDTLDFTKKEILSDKTVSEKINSFLQIVNVGIEDIKVSKSPTEKLNIFESLNNANIPNKKIISILKDLKIELEKELVDVDLGDLNISTAHRKYNDLNDKVDKVYLDFELESKGTQKLIALLGPWFDILNSGGVLFIDELDSSLHTKLTYELIKLFHSPLNKNNAQLIFTSHDTNLLRKDLFRRDQVWFTEKDNYGATDLYSLSEYKVNQATSVRNDASFEKDYLLGKYGAIPYFGDFTEFINNFS